MRKLRVGHVGGRSVYPHLFNIHPRTEVVAVCDINPVALDNMRTALGLSKSQCFLDYDEFLRKTNLEIVVIATPIPFHAEQAIKAMENGIHVLSEVTAADKIEDCERLVRTVKKTDVKYMMAENMCYFHFIREWTKIIHEGRLGRIYYAEGEYIHQVRDLIKDPVTGELKWRAHRPPIHYISHSLGPLLMMLDDRVVKATGAGKGRYTMPDLETVGAIDMQVALFKTEKGATIKILRGQVVAREPPFHYFVIYGSEGCIENTGFRLGEEWGVMYVEGEDEAVRKIKCLISDPEVPEEVRKWGHGTSEYYLVRDFIESIVNDEKPPIDVVKGVDMTIPGIIAHEAAMKGEVWLDVPHFE